MGIFNWQPIYLFFRFWKFQFIISAILLEISAILLEISMTLSEIFRVLKISTAWHACLLQANKRWNPKKIYYFRNQLGRISEVSVHWFARRLKESILPKIGIDTSGDEQTYGIYSENRFDLDKPKCIYILGIYFSEVKYIFGYNIQAISIPKIYIPKIAFFFQNIFHWFVRRLNYRFLFSEVSISFRRRANQ